MNRKFLTIAGCLILTVSSGIWAQQKPDSVMKFTLEQAKAFALENSPLIKNTNLDLETAKKKIWETTSIGLPQVSGKFAYTYMVQVPPLFSEAINGFNSFAPLLPGILTNLQLPASATSALSGLKIPTIDELKWNLTLDITVSQLLFSGSWIVGLQTAKTFKGLSELAITKSKTDLNESVTNAYFLVLISRENKQVIDSTYTNTTAILEQIEAMNKQGFNDETDVDQLRLTTSMIKNSADMLSRQLESATNLLRFQLGLDMSQQIVLTDSLKGLKINLENNALIANDFVLENIIDYKLMDTQEKMAALNVKYNKSAILPDLAAFYAYEHVYNPNAIVLTPPQMVGVSMNIPIFSSGLRWSRISQARIGLMKAQNSKYMVSESLKMGYSDAKTGYLNAMDKYQSNKNNLILSEKIYNRTLIKYKQGMASSLELSQAQNQYLQNQTGYYMSLFELISSKNKLEKYLSN